VKRNFLAAVLLAALASAFADAAESAHNWTYRYLLVTSESERELAPVTEHIIKKPRVDDAVLLDVTAETLLARFDEPNYPEQNKIRLIRVLEARGGPRYHAVLRHVQDRSSQPLVRNAARKALPRKPQRDVDSYVPGSVDLRAIVDEVDAAALAAKPLTDQGRHLAGFTGGSIDQLFEWAGKPHQIVSGQTRVSDGLLINVKIQRLALFYRGLGRVVYGYTPKGWEFQAVVADPLAFEKEFSYRGRAAALGMPDDATLEKIQLVSGYVSAMKIAIQQRFRNPAGADPEFLDTAAEILLQEHSKAADPAAIDTHAWICRLLEQHGNGRYARVLARVAGETRDMKLGRYSRLAADRSREAAANAPQYEPGTVDLAAQRAKYPSIYPDSTFTSGLL
jgi:hypothetical protein